MFAVIYFVHGPSNLLVFHQRKKEGYKLLAVGRGNCFQDLSHKIPDKVLNSIRKMGFIADFKIWT